MIYTDFQITLDEPSLIKCYTQFSMDNTCTI